MPGSSLIQRIASPLLMRARVTSVSSPSSIARDPVQRFGFPAAHAALGERIEACFRDGSRDGEFAIAMAVVVEWLAERIPPTKRAQLRRVCMARS